MKILTLIIVLFIQTACISQQAQKLNPSVYYRPDVCVVYETEEMPEKKKTNFFKRLFSEKYRRNKAMEGKARFCGVGVLPYIDQYKLTIEAHGKLNFFAVTTCHEESTSENPDGGFFSRKKGITTINYVPTIERGRACPLYISTYSKRQKHGHAIMAFEDPRFQLKSKLYCNGFIKSYNGVSICAVREGLIQKIVFDEPVKLVKPAIGAAEKLKPCPSMGEDYQTEYEFKMPKRECIYQFIGKNSRKIHQFFSIGYEDLIIRE